MFSPLASIPLIFLSFLPFGHTLFVCLFFTCCPPSFFNHFLSNQPSVPCQHPFLLFWVCLLDLFASLAANGVLSPKNLLQQNLKSLGSPLLISLLLNKIYLIENIVFLLIFCSLHSCLLDFINMFASLCPKVIINVIIPDLVVLSTLV